MNNNTLKTKYKLKAFCSKKLRQRIEVCGVCPYCKKPNTGRGWCKKCSPCRFLKEGKTSGNREIDRIICEAQRKTRHYDDNLEWIPYDRFQDIKIIGEGGFATIYSATWKDRRNITVALKKLKNPLEAFINEIKIHNECSFANFRITQFYGITKEPDTEKFMMVLAYAEAGNLREYLKNRFSVLKWKDKLEILYNIVDNLEVIHCRKYIHKDLHSGNILQFYYNRWIDTKITDLGLAQLIQNSKSFNASNVCGVLPYIAPEVLDGKEYTFGSDIYSFGIIMTEVSTGKPPYESIPHDGKLALAICNGLRPRVAKGTPQCYIDLVNRCLDANPEKRPSAKTIHEIIKNWLFHKEYNRETKNYKIKIHKEFLTADEINLQEFSLEITINSEAIYTSRYMNFTNLSEPRNSKGIQIEDPEVSDSALIDLHLSNVYFKQSN